MVKVVGNTHGIAAWAIALAIALALASGACIAGDGVWTSAGPDGGTVDGLVASPDTANVFYAVSRGGVFKTVDGGVNWSESSAGINRQLNGLIVHSQTGADRLFAFGSRKAFYTQNGGVSWLDRSPDASLLSATESITAAAVSKTSPGTYYIGLSNGSVLRTSDSGNSWSALPAIPLAAGTFSISAIDTLPFSPDELLVATRDITGGTDHRLYNGNLTPTPWTLVPCPSGCLWESSEIVDIEFAGTGGRVWAATSFNGVGRSDDYGATWTAPGGPVSFIQGRRLAVNPADTTEVYVAGGRTGFAYTVDDGATWTEVFGGFVGNAQLQPAVSVDVVYDPFNTALQLVGSSGNGVYRRTSLVSDSFTPGVAGFNATNIRAVATNLGNVVHAGFGDTFNPTFASFRGTSNGTVWSQANGGLEADQFRALTVDPNDPDVVYAGGVYRPHLDSSGVTFDPGNGGIYKSTDRGVTWTTIDSGIPMTGGMFSNSLFGTVRDIEVDVTSAGPGGDSQILWAAGSGRWTVDDCDLAMPTFTREAARIYRSTDAGATWSPSETGLGGAECSSAGFAIYASAVQIIQDPNNPNNVWAATFIGGAQAGDSPTLPNGVFKSLDGGLTWSLASTGLPHVDGNPALSNETVLSLAIDPTDLSGNTLYASSNELVGGGAPLGTIYKTVDGGASWTFAGTGLTDRDVRDLVVDPLTGDVYAAVTDPLSNGDGGVFVSDDGGASWASISTGFPEAAVATKLAIDNTGSPAILHAGTTRSVQSFTLVPDEDTDGAPTTVEEGAPNSGDGNLDGTSDSVQPGVASPEIANPSRGTSSYVTAEMVGLSGTCGALENSFGLDLLPSVPIESAHEAPFNGLHLRIPDCEQAEVSLTYHGEVFTADPSFAIRAYGLAFPDEDSTAWFEIESGTVIGDTWTFQLSDGGIGDATPDDGVIVFQGAAKRLREAFFADSMEAE